MEAFIPALTGAIGGLFGGNFLARLIGGSQVGLSTGSLVGIVGGIVGQFLIGPELAPVMGASAVGLEPMTIAASLLSGAAGGGILGLVLGIIRRVAS